jgi:hypothetical protein
VNSDWMKRLSAARTWMIGVVVIVLAVAWFLQC